ATTLLVRHASNSAGKTSSISRSIPKPLANSTMKPCHRKARRPRTSAVCAVFAPRSEEHTSELQSQSNLVCRLLLEKKKKTKNKLAIHMSKPWENIQSSTTFSNIQSDNYRKKSSGNKRFTDYTI